MQDNTTRRFEEKTCLLIEPCPGKHPEKHDIEQSIDYTSVREAAKMIGVSPRSVYDYIARGRLQALRFGHIVAVKIEEARAFQRSVVGRPRTRVPVWRVPTPSNQQFLTTIRVRARAGQQEALARRLEHIRAKDQHRLSGTVARYIASSQQDPDEVVIQLVWRQLVRPSQEERMAAITALGADLADLLDWEAACIEEWSVLLSA